MPHRKRFVLHYPAKRGFDYARKIFMYTLGVTHGSRRMCVSHDFEGLSTFDSIIFFSFASQPVAALFWFPFIVRILTPLLFRCSYVCFPICSQSNSS